MRLIVAAGVVFASLALSQDTSVITHRSVDVNGHRVVDGPDIVQTKSPNNSETTEIMQSVNGRRVPLERRDERVLRDDASGRVVETLIHTYNQEGNATQPVKQILEERKQPDGSSTIQTATYRADINGQMQLLQKSITDVHKSGSSETSETLLQRPSVNGSLETVEKRTTVTTTQSGGYQREANTYQRDGTGNFALAVKESTEHSEAGDASTENTARYEVTDGRLQLHSQTVSKVVKRPDGSKETEVDVFAPNTLGTVETSGSQKLKIREQQIIEKKPGPGGSVVETVSFRRPSLSDQTVLGPAQQISETICRGKCEN